MGFSENYASIFEEIMESNICVGQAVLYAWYAVFLESKGKLYEAQMVYQMGISRSISSPLCYAFVFTWNAKYINL